MIVDINNKFVKVERLSGEDKPVAFIEYREHSDENRVMTGPLGCLPHLDPYETGVELLYAVREKYPHGDWVMETEPAWCARPEYLAMIQRGIDDGHVFYDKIGQYVQDQQIGLVENWKYQALAVLGPESDMPTASMWDVLNEIALELATNP